MKTLFIVSGNSDRFDTAPFIKAQADSLRSLGCQVEIFPVKGKGVCGYLRNAVPLIKLILAKRYDIIHAHYSFCGYLAVLVGAILKLLGVKRTPIIASLMGSDVESSGFERTLVSFAARFLWKSTIVKSVEMKNKLTYNNVFIIPNGVNIDSFRELNKEACRSTIGLDKHFKYILFAGDPQQRVKNFSLAKAAYQKLNESLTRLYTIGSIPHYMMPQYLNACDVLLLTSLWEGSPNIVKEAMACNTPVVSVDVGDVQWLLENVDGCHIVKAEPLEIAQKLKDVLNFPQKTRGRERLIMLDLDSESVAKRVLSVYEKALHDM